MSAKLMGRVWDLDLPNAQQSVLLALADHADHQGRNVYPSVGLVAWKVGYHERTVQRIVAQLLEAGLLVKVRDSRGPRPTEYEINLEAGRVKEPYSSTCEGWQFATPGAALGVANHASRGDTAMPPKPLTVKEPPLPPTPHASEGGLRDRDQSEGLHNGELAAQQLSELADRCRPAIGDANVGMFLAPCTPSLDETSRTLTLAGPTAVSLEQATFRKEVDRAAGELGLVLQFDRPPPPTAAPYRRQRRQRRAA